MSPTPSSPPELPGQQQNNARWPKRWIVGVAAGMVVTAGASIGYGRYFIFQRLSPQIEQQLSKTINRPIQIGRVQGLSWRELRFGASELPPTEASNDRIQVEAIAVDFNLWTLLIRRQLDLNLTLVNPQITVEQNEARRWLDLEITPDDSDDDDLKVNINRIQLRRGQLTLIARQRSGALSTPVNLAIVSGKGNLSNDNKVIDLDVKGKLDEGGELEVSGILDFDQDVSDLDIRGKKLNPAAISHLLVPPVTFADGFIDGFVNLKLEDGDVVSWSGEVVAQDSTLDVPGLAKPIREFNGRIGFQDQALHFKQATGQLGELNFGGDLIVDFEGGYTGQLEATAAEIALILDAFELEAPAFPVEGELAATVTFGGLLDDLELTVAAVNATPLTVDRLTIDSFQGDMAIEDGRFVIEQFTAQPTLGGNIVGQGTIQLASDTIPTGAIAITAQGTELPTNALAQLYEIELPVQAGLGRTDVLFEAPLDQVSEFLVSGTAVVPVAGGFVTMPNLRITQTQWQTPARAEGLRLAQLLTEEVPPFLQQSLVNGDFQVSGTFAQPENNQPEGSLAITGQARTSFASGQAIARNIVVEEGQWRADLDLNNLDLKQLLPAVPRSLVANYSGQFQTSGPLENVGLDTTIAQGSGRITVGQGEIRTEGVTLAGGEWYSRTLVNNVNLVDFAPQLANLEATIPSQGQFDVRGNVNNLVIEGILAQGSLNAQLAGGTVRGGLLTLQNGQFQGDFTAQNLNLDRLNDSLTGLGDGTVQLVADVTQPNLRNLQAQGDLRLSEGIALIDSPLRSRWAWNGRQLQIQEAIAQNFRADGLFDIDSDRLGRNPIQAITQIALNLDAQNLDLENLRQLPLPEAAQALALTGQGGFRGTIQGTIQQPQINGQLALANVQLAELTLDPLLEGQIQTRSDRRTVLVLEGEQDQISARFNAFLRPEQAQFNLDGATLELALDYDQRGLEPTRLELSSANLPLTLVQQVAQGQPALRRLDFPLETVALGGRISSELRADLVARSASGQVAIAQPMLGYLSGDRLMGNFYFANETLRLQNLEWTQNGGRYIANSTIALPNAQRPSPRIQLTSNIEQGRIEDVLAALQIFDYEDFQYLSSLSLQDYLGRSSRFGRSEDLYAGRPLSPPVTTEVISMAVPSKPALELPDAPVLEREQYRCDTLLNDGTEPDGEESLILYRQGDRQQSFIERLALLSCVQAQLEMNVAETKPLLPAELADLQGEFSGNLSFIYDAESGLQADFDLAGGYQEVTVAGESQIAGSPWQWGEITIPQVIARGVLRDQVLTLRPVGIRLSEADGGGNLSFIGSFGGEAQTGQLRLNEVPMAFLEKFVDLPEAVTVDGFVNATAALAGTPANPSARGEMTLAAAEINDTPINSVKGNFTYNNARLDFIVDSELVAEATPLKITGSMPYRLPNATVFPENNELNLAFNLEDESFALLNILTRGQLMWLGGEGQADLEIRGEIDLETGRPIDLVADGQVAIAQAQVQAQVLPDAPLTNVQGQIDFDFDTLTVRELTGDFSGGQVAITGQLPLARRTGPEQTLQVSLEDLDFSLTDLYQGGVAGNLVVAGTSLEPTIGGDLTLQSGRIFLTEGTQGSNGNGNNGNGNGQTPEPDENGNGGLDLRAITEFDNLRITLGDRIQITRQPILNFLATGDLILNGTLDNLRPAGEIQLNRGQVNLFATQLRLGGNRNVAIFNPNFGLDPELDITLETSLLENSRFFLSTTNPLSAEIRDTTVFGPNQFGTIETIRIQARVRGRASNLDENIELTSSPPRSETELISLLGGSFLENFTGGSTSETLALANLAGSALLSNLQNVIGSALGLSELRLFPTVITNDENTGSSTLGIGAELSANISPDLSVSVLQIINSNQSTQFGLRYRVNDQLFIRGSTDLNDDNRFSVEYDVRF
ncbi:translocation/assembly module TamB domain-containing protein [Picosynechococcus sp. NKBG15041c]|uniref:translocation/assembly module TamB domain-containing protein n=1 Tax=Picosynechococcus sp. NKBG15041c TaxID=1407650 RepID=UPI000426C51C|nr:translocation/assembly module TamB domain-containing protein [Picosynechococcus sp. NKBG15041c]